MMITPENNDDNDTLTDATCNLQLGSLTCDTYHHFYHYQASAQYLWLAQTLSALGQYDAALIAYDKAIFQDHSNEDAIKEKALAGQRGEVIMPRYYKHSQFDAAFCESVGRTPSPATRLHDDGMVAILDYNYDHALLFLGKAIAADPAHSNSYFARGKCYFAEHNYDNARADFEEAIRLSHMDHDTYHRFASSEHVRRGEQFLERLQYDLAIADFSKALDLHRRNREALSARAKAYRAKGAADLAQNDEKEAQRLGA